MLEWLGLVSSLHFLTARYSWQLLEKHFHLNVKAFQFTADLDPGGSYGEILHSVPSRLHISYKSIHFLLAYQTAPILSKTGQFRCLNNCSDILVSWWQKANRVRILNITLTSSKQQSDCTNQILRRRELIVMTVVLSWKHTQTWPLLQQILAAVAWTVLFSWTLNKV